MNDVQSRFVVMGLDDPQSHFKTVGLGLEKYGTSDPRKFDMDIEDGPRQRGSMVNWLNITN